MLITPRRLVPQSRMTDVRVWAKSGTRGSAMVRAKTPLGLPAMARIVSK